MSNMFCFQCQEAAGGTGCTIKGVCGKKPEVARMQDLLIYTAKGVAVLSREKRKQNTLCETLDRYLADSLFTTITNANFDMQVIADKVLQGLALRDHIKENIDMDALPEWLKNHDVITWKGATIPELEEKAKNVGVLVTKDKDIRSLRELLTYGLKGMAAYAEHALNLGYSDNDVFGFMEKGLIATLDESLSVEDLTNLVLECGKFGVSAMALLDKANTSTYGHPEITQVNIGTRNNPGILISGHDLKDLEELLKQTEGSGIDVYTHSEMLPAHYYPAFKKYDHFTGNYGNSWWKQTEEFETFNGPILFTTNCLVPPRKKSTYSDRVFTTGTAGFSGFPHIEDRPKGGTKDFSPIIEMAKTCKPPVAIENGTITGGFAHNQVVQLADKVVDAVKSGAIRKFIVMAGCDGRMKSREYYTEFAQKLPKDTVILTAGCAKYRYNKLPLGDIGGIPRILDAGQCNDSYSLAVIALKLKELFELNDINELPISYNIAWYEQKAIIVLLALLYLGVKNIHLGPTLPAFLSPNVTDVLVKNFGIAPIGSVDEDIKLLA